VFGDVVSLTNGMKSKEPKRGILPGPGGKPAQKSGEKNLKYVKF